MAKTPIQTPPIRRGQPDVQLGHDAFAERYRKAFSDPAFTAEDAAVERLVKVAWEAYVEGRKAPLTRKAGPG